MIESELIEAGTYQKQIPEQTREHILSSVLDHFTEISTSFFLSKIKAFPSSAMPWAEGESSRRSAGCSSGVPGRGERVDPPTAAGPAARQHPGNLDCSVSYPHVPFIQNINL